MSAARVLLASLVARAAYGLAYLAASLGGLPIPRYYPLERRWALELPGAAAPRLAMAWFGATATALTAAAALGALAFFASGRGPLGRLLCRPAAILAVARAGGLILLVDFVYFGWTLTHQTPAPLPLPAWYCPR